MINRVADHPPSQTTPTSKAPVRPLIRSSDISELAQPLEKLIVKYPGAALASAFLIGVVVAWWIKRK
jgi:hypothetical protein